jgi:hypothetical protein
MKIVPLLLVALAGSLAAAPVPELRGIYVEDGKALFVLVDPDTGVSSRWLALGQEFEGYVLKEFKTEADTVRLVNAGAEHLVRLHAAKVRYAATTLSGTIEIGRGQHALRLERATLVFDEENAFPVADGLTLTIKPVLRKDETIAYYARFEQAGADGAKRVLASPTIVTRPGMPFSMRIGELGFSLKP